MKKTITKIATIICAMVLVFSICAITVFACADPCANKSLKIEDVGILWWQTEKATAKLEKCNCNPVDNTLKVWLRVQYEDNGDYYWDPVDEGIFYYTEKNNTSEVSV